MGRAAVRTAVTTTIQNANIPYVGTVFPARPTLLDENAYSETMFGTAVDPSANGTNAVVVVNLPGRDQRLMRALTGRQGVADTQVVPVVLEVFASSTGGTAQGAQEDYDTIVDALVVLIRNTPVMSAPQSVWSAGEFRPGVTHSQIQAFSSDDGLSVFIAGAVTFEAWEWLEGLGV